MWIRVHNTPGTPGFLKFFFQGSGEPLENKIVHLLLENSFN